MEESGRRIYIAPVIESDPSLLSLLFWCGCLECITTDTPHGHQCARGDVPTARTGAETSTRDVTDADAVAGAAHRPTCAHRCCLEPMNVVCMAVHT